MSYRRRPLGPLRPSLRFAALGLVALAVLGAACTTDDEPDTDATTSPTVTSTATLGASVGDAQRDEVDRAPCADVAQAMTAAFPDRSLIEDASAFSAGSLTGEGCRVLVLGTAEELPPFVEVSQTLRGILEEAGWTEDPEYVADGPTGTLSVYERDGELAVVSAGVAPQEPTACAPDEIIGECLDELAPSEVIVQGSIIVAR